MYAVLHVCMTWSGIIPKGYVLSIIRTLLAKRTTAWRKLMGAARIRTAHYGIKGVIYLFLMGSKCVNRFSLWSLLIGQKKTQFLVMWLFSKCLPVTNWTVYFLMTIKSLSIIMRFAFECNGVNDHNEISGLWVSKN